MHSPTLSYVAMFWYLLLLAITHTDVVSVTLALLLLKRYFDF